MYVFKASELHLPKNAFRCDDCTNSFKAKSTLLQHMLTHCETDNAVKTILSDLRYDCVLRNEMTPSSSVQPNLPYACVTCKKVSTATSLFLKYMNLHFPKNPFKCEV